MKLSIVVPFLNNYPLAKAAIASLEENLAAADSEIIALNNGSSEGEFVLPAGSTARVVTLPENIGNYPVFALCPSLASSESDLIGVFHSDLFVHEPGFDRRIRDAFARYPQLGLLGFIGSNEIDTSGGRGLGTVSNFQGAAISRNGQVWHGSPAEAHGRRSTGLERAAVIDGCAMVFRRSVLSAIRRWSNFPPHHFYDRLLSCQVMEMGYLVAVLSVACDHISGQTANSNGSYRELARAWCLQHLGLETCDNWDLEIYRQAEARWLLEYRDRKHFIPVRVPSELVEASGRNLNLGCDTYYLPGFLNLDLYRDANVTPDVISDARNLPFLDDVFDFIYAGHLVEHLYYDRLPEYLIEWRRVLRPNGRLTVVVPDVGTGMRRYAAGVYSLDHVLPQIFGPYYSGDLEPQRHRYAYDYPRLIESLGRVPWRTVAQLDFNRPPEEIRPHVGAKISTADWQMGVVLTK
jgi:glycosyltransferase involved in cell wall biosynthesis